MKWARPRKRHRMLSLTCGMQQSRSHRCESRVVAIGANCGTKSQLKRRRSLWCRSTARSAETITTLCFHGWNKGSRGFHHRKKMINVEKTAMFNLIYRLYNIYH